MKKAAINETNHFSYTERNHRLQIQQLRIDVIKYVVGILTFALSVPALVLIAVFDHKVPRAFLDQGTLALVLASWGVLTQGIIFGVAYLALAPRWVIWRKHERFLNVCYTLCPIMLLLGTILIALLYLQISFGLTVQTDMVPANGN